MTKRTIKETIREYDADGKLVKETVTETVEDDDTNYVPYYPLTTPYNLNITQPWTSDPVTYSSINIAECNGGKKCSE